MSTFDTYTSPLAERNASPEMLRLWSPRHKFNTWRRIWLAVAEAQHEMGLPVTKEQVEELRAVVERGITDAEIELAKKYERELRHDVMAHVHALGDSCPKAKGIIHLGMTSQDVVCNADLRCMRDSLVLVQGKAARLTLALGEFSYNYRAMPTLGFTHYQPAQPVTVGRRAAGWVSDIRLSVQEFCVHAHKFRGLRGATGTQASFLSLFDGDSSRVDKFENLFLHFFLDCRVNRRCKPSEERCDRDAWSEVVNRELPEVYERADIASGMSPEEARAERIKAIDARNRRNENDYVNMLTFTMTGQTYPRAHDCNVLGCLATLASVLHKIATDIRLLCNRKEIDEPFESKQIGSSAMPYKRNPMRCERICGLTRFVMNLVGNAYDTAATQWLERTLDDSSNRRLSLPEAFLALDGALDLMHNVASGLIVHEAMVRKNLMAELPFMATENLLMECVKLGGDRQHYHEVIRQHAQAAGMRVKQEGLDNDLLDRLKADQNFWGKARGGPLAAELNWDGLMDPMKYVGRSVEQTERFIKEVVEPLRQQYGDAIAKLGESAPKV